jgi:hypothetical protein
MPNLRDILMALSPAARRAANSPALKIGEGRDLTGLI